jgi:AcrR family transcriptional regulator
MSPREELSEARRTQILRAAVGVIGERGVCDTRISDIAARAGTSSALVLYYFETKDRLLAEALAFSEDRFYEETAAELATIESARDRLVRLIELSCSADTAEEHWVDEWVLWLDMWARSPRDPDVGRNREAMDRRWRDQIADIVRAGQARGEFGPVDPDDFALRLSALNDGLVIQVVLGDPAVSPSRMTEICLRMAAGELGFEVPARPSQRPSKPARPDAPAAKARTA